MRDRFVGTLRRYVSLGSIKQIALKPWLIVKIPGYLGQLSAYQRMERQLGMQSVPVRLYPCLNDNQGSQQVSYYFYQDSWAARQVFREKPSFVVDIGSTVLLVGILSQFTRCISVDIRPVLATMDGLGAVSASTLKLPFADNSIPCLTTMCVLEHIGLGRYGDPLNPKGTLEAVAEISRVIAPGGFVVYSVPVGIERLEINANRRFRLEEAQAMFSDWEKIDACILTPAPVNVISNEIIMKVHDPVACFCMRKPL